MKAPNGRVTTVKENKKREDFLLNNLQKDNFINVIVN